MLRSGARRSNVEGALEQAGRGLQVARDAYVVLNLRRLLNMMLFMGGKKSIQEAFDASMELYHQAMAADDIYTAINIMSTVVRMYEQITPEAAEIAENLVETILSRGLYSRGAMLLYYHVNYRDFAFQGVCTAEDLRLLNQLIPIYEANRMNFVVSLLVHMKMKLLENLGHFEEILELVPLTIALAREASNVLDIPTIASYGILAAGVLKEQAMVQHIEELAPEVKTGAPHVYGILKLIDGTLTSQWLEAEFGDFLEGDMSRVTGNMTDREIVHDTCISLHNYITQKESGTTSRYLQPPEELEARPPWDRIEILVKHLKTRSEGGLQQGDFFFATSGRMDVKYLQQSIDFPTVQCKLMFYYLSKYHQANREDIMDAVWKDPVHMDNVKITVRNIRLALKHSAVENPILTIRSGYSFNPSYQVRYDHQRLYENPTPAQVMTWYPDPFVPQWTTEVAETERNMIASRIETLMGPEIEQALLMGEAARAVKVWKYLAHQNPLDPENYHKIQQYGDAQEQHLAELSLLELERGNVPHFFT